MATNKVPKSSMKYYCKKCDYGACRKSQFDRHLLTLKHDLATNGNENSSKNTLLVCEWCNKEYHDRSGLWRHKKKCLIPEIQETTNKIDTSDKDILIDKLIKTITIQSEQMGQQMVQQSEQLSKLIPKIGDVNSHNTINNKQKFNINVFLNETCKDAMSITEFTESLVLKLEDMMYSKDNGTIEGLSNIIIKNLNDIDVEKRPIHCTDLKRETLYIKDKGVGWEKEGIERDKMKKMISITQQKHGKLLSDWQKAFPDWETNEHKTAEFHDLVSKLCYEDGGENKIIKNIAKEITLNKKD